MGAANVGALCFRLVLHASGGHWLAALWALEGPPPGHGSGYGEVDEREAGLGDLPGRLDVAVRRAVPGAGFDLAGHDASHCRSGRAGYRLSGTQLNFHNAITRPPMPHAATMSRSVPAKPVPVVCGL